jgi:hypothetical protein
MSPVMQGFVCEHAFVTAQGRPTPAYEGRSSAARAEAPASASELEHVGLVEALELVLLLCRREPKRFPRAAHRWHGRYCHEVRDVGLEEAQVLLAALAALPSRRGPAAAPRLGRTARPARA